MPPKIVSAIYSDPAQESLRTFANHLLVIIAFFLPISNDAVKSGFFILILLMLIQKKPLRLIKNALSNRVILAIFGIWAIHIIGISYSSDFTVSTHYAGEMIFLLYPLLVVQFTQYRFLGRIFSAFILGVFLSELLSYAFFFELLTSPIPQSLGGFALASKNEPSPFTYHIEYGYILAITSALILQRLLTKTSRNEKIIFILFLTTITLNIFFNSARTGYILFFLSNGTVLLFHYKTQILKKLHFIISFVLILITIAWTTSSNVQREYQETLHSISAMYHDGNFDSSLGMRFNFLRMGISAVMETHPFIGFGTGMHGEVIYNQAIKENNTEMIHWLSYIKDHGTLLFTDCEYNSIFLQFGLIGLLIYLNLFFQIIRFDQKDSNLKAIQQMILLSSVFYALVQSLLFGVLVPLLFTTLLAFTLVKQPSHEEQPLLKLKFNGILIYTFSAIGLFVLSKIT